jgi:hypothetical protein
MQSGKIIGFYKEGIDERISNAVDTQHDELNVQLNDIVHCEQQRLAQVHEAAVVKQEEIYQKSLHSQDQKSIRTQQKMAQTETAALVKNRELEARLETLQLEHLQVERNSQNQFNVAEATLVDVKTQLQSSEAQLIKSRDSRNEVEKELQSKVATLTEKTATLESKLKDSESQLAVSRQQAEVPHGF